MMWQNNHFFPVGGDMVLITKLSSEGTSTIEWEILCFLYTSEELVQDTNTNLSDIILCFGKTTIQNSFSFVS